MIKSEVSLQQELIENYQRELSSALSDTFKSQIRNLMDAGKILRDTLLNGNQIFLIGNGGSSSQCNHAEAEFYYWKKNVVNQRLRGSIRSLSANPDTLTAIANDEGEESMFSMQLKSIYKNGDSILAISTSGQSSDIYNALYIADNLGLSTVGLLGKNGGKALELLDVCIMVQTSMDTNIIQDVQSSLCHILLKLVMTDNV